MLHIWMEAVRGNILGCYKQQRDGEIVQGLPDMVKHRQSHRWVTVNSAAMVAHRVWYVELEEWLWVKNHLNSQVEWYVCILVAFGGACILDWQGRGASVVSASGTLLQINSPRLFRQLTDGYPTQSITPPGRSAYVLRWAVWKPGVISILGTAVVP